MDTEQPISHTRTANTDTSVCLYNSDGKVLFQFQKSMNISLSKVHNILDNAVTKQDGNTAHILAYLFNTASR